MPETDVNSEDNTLVSDLLISTGVSPSLNGFGYLKEAILVYDGNEGDINAVYEEVGRKYGAKALTVERAMRSALKQANKKGTLRRLNEFLCADYVKADAVISNKEFVSVIAEYMRIGYFKTILRENLASRKRI